MEDAETIRCPASGEGIDLWICSREVRLQPWHLVYSFRERVGIW